jgi:hypothetical protein
LDDLIFAAKRLDLLGMKIQFTKEMNQFYWDAFQNQRDAKRVESDLNEIGEINGRLEDLRDATTELRSFYARLWVQQYQPYWLDNVLVRYDNLASLYQNKIEKITAIREQADGTHSLPSPEELGFYWKQ